MKKNQVLRNLTLSVSLVYFTSTGFGQDLGARISKTTVGIFNNSNNKMEIKLGSSDSTLKVYQLPAMENWVSPAYNFDPLAKLESQNKTVKYRLKRDNKYMIYWDKNKKYWDLKKIKK